jgi:hypothetical protein
MLEEHLSQKKIEEALELIKQYALIDGEHHKNWLLVEVTKVLCGGQATYKKFVDSFDEVDEDDAANIHNGWENMLMENCIAP